MMKKTIKVLACILAIVMSLSVVVNATTLESLLKQMDPSTMNAQIKTESKNTVRGEVIVDGTTSTNDKTSSSVVNPFEGPDTGYFEGDKFIFEDNAVLEESVNGNVYIFGQNVEIGKDVVILGNAFVGGNSVTIEANVSGTIFLLGENAVVNGECQDLYAFSTNFILGENAYVERDVKVAGNNVTIKGSINRDLVSAASNTSIGGGLFTKVVRNIAYSGTLESGAVMTTMNSAGVNTMRVDLFPITDGVGSGTVFSYNKCGSFGKNVLGDDYELMVSPLAENGTVKTYVIDGSLANASEFEMVDGANEVTVKGANALVNVKSNGANYFKYAGRSLMVAPKVNADGLVEGVQMFDITDGFSNAVEITLDGATIEPVAYTYASAHGELAITTNTADVTTAADIELFLAVDGKVTKFNVGDFYTTADIARGTINGTANPFAYALKSEVAENTLNISYSLNADATDVISM